MLVYHRERVWLENSLAIREVGDKVGAGQVQKQVVQVNDPQATGWYVKENGSMSG
jgi:hypothetical protein